MAVHRAESGPLSVSERTGLPLLVALGGGLARFVGLGRESIWLDEATSIIIARMNPSSVVAWAAGDIHPPLYYLALHFWLYLGETEFAVRALSAVFGTLTIVVMYALASELFGRQVGLLSALLLAVSPLHIWYSQEARMYVMVALFSSLASYLMLLVLRRRQNRYWFGYVVASLLALYTHYFALFVLLFQNLFVVYWLWRRKGSQGLWRTWLLAELAIVLLFLPWVPILYHQATTGGGGWVEKSVGQPSLRSIADTWLYFSTGLNRQLYPVMVRRLAYVLFAVCLLAALSRLFSDREREGLLFCLMYVAVPVLAAWLLSQVKPMYTIRYLLPFLPPYCVLVAMGVDALKWNRRHAGLPVAVFLVLVLLLGDWNALHVQNNPDWRGVSSYVLSRALPGDVVLFSPRWNEKPFDYYARGGVEINMDLPIPVTVSSAQGVVADVVQRNSRVWLIWEKGHYSDPDGKARQILDARFREVEERAFPGVGNVILYDLSVGSGGG